MDRYYCPHGSYSEYDRQRCKQCRDRARVLRNGPERACGDCLAYAPVKTMTTKADGRVICPACELKLSQVERDKAQANLFVQQESLF